MKTPKQWTELLLFSEDSIESDIEKIQEDAKRSVNIKPLQLLEEFIDAKLEFHTQPDVANLVRVDETRGALKSLL